MKTLVDTFNQEKALVRGLLHDCTTGCGTDGSFYSINHFSCQLMAVAHTNGQLSLHNTVDGRVVNIIRWGEANV